MNFVHSTSGTGNHEAVVTRVSDLQWQAVEGDRAVGRGDASRRPDGRLFLSIDAWHGAVFDRIADAMLADLPTPLYTVVDEADHDSRSAWERAGFTTARREWGYLVPTDPQGTGLGSVRPPSDLTIVPAGEAEEGPLRALDSMIRDEVEAAVGWQTMPAEVLPRPAGSTLLDPSKYAVARHCDQYVGLVRVAPLTRQPRIGLIAVRTEWHRRGIARAMLAHALGSLHRSGTASAWAEVNESNAAATALFEGIGARRVGSTLELVRRWRSATPHRATEPST
ncbi:GCN5 family acetyltransferase [Streptomyces cellostaticus]|uniref:GCN5 family acetyltransferase n=1 Tax=Streptomyces cellostaticus TaxID=67285 RepID=A0A101NGL2_9ACTN|nr:GNAT family N-acetyltransferase [Streptomyces cellostaticus]KUM92597.1 GCN5 family acetyltransferase [Streptomyces cellostaticus]GHI10498.1 ribosomal-protein-alanine N-acetyltransferase [Streptomyces cellostaticus]